MPTSLLRTFIAVAESGSITNAASLISRSQPAVTLRIKKLEDMLEAQLFLRKDRCLILSEEGHLLFGYAQQILKRNDEAVRKLLKNNETTINLGIPNEIAVSSFFPVLLENFSIDYPRINVEVNCDKSENLRYRIREGKLDLAAVLENLPNQTNKNLQWDEKASWISKKNCKHHEQRPLPLIVGTNECVYRERMFSILNSKGIEWRIAYSSDNFNGILAGIDAGLGVTAIANIAVSGLPNSLKTINELPSINGLQIQLIQSIKTPSTPALEKLKNELTQIITNKKSN